MSSCGLEDHPESGSDHRLVVDEHDADRHAETPFEREGRVDGEPAVGSGAGTEVAAVQAARSRMPIRPWPPSVPRRLGPAGTVVEHFDLERRGPVADADGGGRGSGVLAGVGEGFLDDPVGRHLEGGRQRPGIALDREVHGQLALERCATRSPSWRDPVGG